MTRRHHPRLLSACLALALLVTVSGCSLLDTINRLPGTLGGKTSRAQVDYLTTDGMRTAMKAFTDTVGADAQVVGISFSRDTATVTTKGKGTVELRSGETSRPGLTPPDDAAATVALSSLDPVAASDRVTAATGCTSPTALGLVVKANGVVATNLYCGRAASDPIYTQLGEGQVLGDLDLATGEGMATAWRNIQQVLPPDETLVSWGISYVAGSGQMTAVGVTTTTVRYGTQNERDIPVLTQTYQAPSTLNSVKPSDISIDVVIATHATAVKECGEVRSIGLQVPATKGAPPWLTFSDLKTCVVSVDLAGNRI